MRRLLCAIGFHIGLVERARLVLIRSDARLWKATDGGKPRRLAPRHVWHEERFYRCWCGRVPEAT